MRTWFAMGRVPSDEVGQRINRFERMLRSISQLNEGLGCPVPDTLVLRKGAGYAYTCDPLTSIVTRQTVSCLEKVVKATYTRNGEEEPNSIIACWMSERTDRKGSIWTCEYFTQESLWQYVVDNGPYMTGVLQRYVCPKLHLGVNEVNQSLFAHSHFIDDTLVLERRYLSDVFHTSNEHPTIRACLYPSIQVEGKVDVCKTLPFTPGELYPVQAELINPEEAGNLIGTVMRRLANAMERSRADRCQCNLYDVRPVGFMVAEFRFNIRDDRLYLINVLHVRHMGDQMSPSTGFELARIVPTTRAMRRIQAVGGDEFALVDDQFQFCGRELRGREWVGYDFEEDGDEGRSPIRARQAPSNSFACPNCNALCLREELVSVPYSFMLDRFCAAHRSRQRSRAADTEPMEEGYWAALPAVLRKANADIASMVVSKAWRLRSVALCAECRAAMGCDDGGSPAPLSSIRRVSNEPEHLRPSPPTCLRSDVIDGFVTTKLQLHHRDLRRVERSKYAAAVVDGGRNSHIQASVILPNRPSTAASARSRRLSGSLAAPHRPNLDMPTPSHAGAPLSHEHLAPLDDSITVLLAAATAYRPQQGTSVAKDVDWLGMNATAASSVCGISASVGARSAISLTNDERELLAELMGEA